MLTTEPIVEVQPLVLHLRPETRLTPAQFFDLCQLNETLVFEQEPDGDILITPLPGARHGIMSLALSAQLADWAKVDGTGVVFGALMGFILPNDATRALDVAWVRRSRLTALTQEERERFLPLCLDFVAEVRVESDALARLQGKMGEYIANGARLGWLIDTVQRRVYVYRPDQPVETLDAPAHLAGDPLLPGFVLDLVPIWEPGF